MVMARGLINTSCGLLAAQELSDQVMVVGNQQIKLFPRVGNLFSMLMLTVMLAVMVAGGVVAGCRDGGGRSHAARGGGQLAGDFTLSEKPICLSTDRKQVGAHMPL